MVTSSNVSGLTCMSEKALEHSERTALWIVSLLMARFSMLPELLDFFSYDAKKLLQFIDRFGGMNIAVPPRQEVGRMARDINIYRSLSAAKSPENVKRLANLYGVTEERVKQIFAETDETLASLDKRSGCESRNSSGV